MKTIEERFAIFVKHRRKELNMTQTQLSEKALGYATHQQISEIERGVKGVSSHTMEKILKVLNSDLEFKKKS